MPSKQLVREYVPRFLGAEPYQPEAEGEIDGDEQQQRRRVNRHREGRGEEEKEGCTGASAVGDTRGDALGEESSEEWAVREAVDALD